MIRRPPTRIELKTEDLQEFDYYQKMEKKRAPPTQESHKQTRQERIGYVSRAIATRANLRAIAEVGAAGSDVSAAAAGSSSASTSLAATPSASTAAATAGSESVPASVSSSEVEGGGNIIPEAVAHDISNEESLLTAPGMGTPDLSTNMSMDITD